jgi:ubiquinol-cytochrome c reductase cytochrome c subunit
MEPADPPQARKEHHVRRTMILFAGVAVLAVALVPATSGATSGARAQTGGQSAQQRLGREIYLESCAACHGPDPNGPSAYSTVPSLRDVGGAAAVDWAVRTGRMPWRSTKGPVIQRGKSHFSEAETLALDAYVGEAVGDTLIPPVDPAKGDLTRGQQAYAQACAACHGMNGAGSALGGDNIAPTMLGVSPLDVAEAIKVGPGQMPPGGGLPNYSPTDPQSVQRVNDITAYVEALNTDRFNRGGAPIGGKGPVPEGFVAWVIGLGLLVLTVRWLGTRT